MDSSKITNEKTKVKLWFVLLIRNGYSHANEALDYDTYLHFRDLGSVLQSLHLPMFQPWYPLYVL
jgi:hypothetical protein